MTETQRTTSDEARRVGDEIGVDWSRFDLEQFRVGMDVEFEHGSHDPQTDVTGDAVTASDARYSRPAATAASSPAIKARLAPRWSAWRPAQKRDTSDAANWLPATRPTTNVLMPNPSWTCTGSTGIATPMTRYPTKTTVRIDSTAPASGATVHHSLRNAG